MSYIMHLKKLLADMDAQEKESTGSSEVSSTSKDTRVTAVYKSERERGNDSVTYRVIEIRVK